MPSNEQLLEKLREVIDPELGLNIVDLGMVKNVSVHGGKVSLDIALTVKGCPLSATIERDATRVLTEVPGVSSVSIKMGTMSKEEMNALGAKLQEMRSQQKSVGKAPGLSAGIDRLEKKGIQNIIAVMSGKGGVGKSYVTAMLAVELRRQGYEVGILDGDITGPSIAKIFGLVGKPMADENGVIPKKTSTGIKVISMNLLLDTPDTPVIWRGPIINGVIRQLFNDVNWGDLHFMLVDLPPGTGDAPLTVFQSLPVDALVVVTTPQDLAMLIVRKAINMARQMNVPIAGIVENMSYMKCPHCSERIQMFQNSRIDEASESLKVNFLGELPFDPEVNRLADAGLIESYSSDETTEVTRKVRLEVDRLTGLKPAPIAWKKAQSTS
ncbi:MAG: Mrp/NBP35 family ATP-binding protein [Candidatus Marsarchaeota archaeon]|nr:Mrp/NBP35 family ATP-binding protein [Candidatus Marsarchaeota archaeon]